MSAGAQAAYRSNFTGWFAPAGSRKSPENKPFHGHWSAYSGTYNSHGRKGIGCGLGNVQKLRDGEPLGGGTTAKQDFGAPVQSTTYPQQAQQPTVYPQQSVGGAA